MLISIERDNNDDDDERTFIICDKINLETDEVVSTVKVPLKTCFILTDNVCPRENFSQ